MLDACLWLWRYGLAPDHGDRERMINVGRFVGARGGGGVHHPRIQDEVLGRFRRGSVAYRCCCGLLFYLLVD